MGLWEDWKEIRKKSKAERKRARINVLEVRRRDIQAEQLKLTNQAELLEGTCEIREGKPVLRINPQATGVAIRCATVRCFSPGSVFACQTAPYSLKGVGAARTMCLVSWIITAITLVLRRCCLAVKFTTKHTKKSALSRHPMAACVPNPATIR